jgi:hypothetical protein
MTLGIGVLTTYKNACAPPNTKHIDLRTMRIAKDELASKPNMRQINTSMSATWLASLADRNGQHVSKPTLLIDRKWRSCGLKCRVARGSLDIMASKALEIRARGEDDHQQMKLAASEAVVATVIIGMNDRMSPGRYPVQHTRRVKD